MGIEYMLRFPSSDQARAAKALRRLPSADEGTSRGLRFDFGGLTPTDGSPQATVQVEPDGVYFCDHCGSSGRTFLGYVVAALAAEFGEVNVSEL